MCNDPCFLCGDSDECELYQKELAIMNPLAIPSEVYDELEDDNDGVCEEQS